MLIQHIGNLALDWLYFHFNEGKFIRIRRPKEVQIFPNRADDHLVDAALLALNKGLNSFFTLDGRLVIGDFNRHPDSMYFEISLGEVPELVRNLGCLTKAQRDSMVHIANDFFEMHEGVINNVASVCLEQKWPLDPCHCFALVEPPILHIGKKSKWLMTRHMGQTLRLWNKESMHTAWQSRLVDALTVEQSWRPFTPSLSDMPTHLRAIYVNFPSTLQAEALYVKETLFNELVEAYSPELANEIKLKLKNPDSVIVKAPFCNPTTLIYVLSSSPAIVIKGLKCADGYQARAISLLHAPVDPDPAALTAQMLSLGMIGAGSTLTETRAEHRKVLESLKPKPLVDKPKKQKSAQPAKPVMKPKTQTSITSVTSGGFGVSVSKRVIKKTKADPSPVQPSDAIKKERLSIRSFSFHQDGAVLVDCAVNAMEVDRQIRYRFDAPESDGVLINCELLALRDILLYSEDIAHHLGAEDIDLVVSKGAIKKMLRSDSAKLNANWEAVRYLMARCCGSKVAVEKGGPFCASDVQVKHLGMGIIEADETIQTALGRVRISHHAVKRVIERSDDDKVNAWSIATSQLSVAHEMGESGNFSKVKHRKDGDYLATSQWRFVVGKDKAGAERVVYTAYPNNRKLKIPPFGPRP